MRKSRAQFVDAIVEADHPFFEDLDLVASGHADLAQTVPPLTRLTKETTPLLGNQVRPAASCTTSLSLRRRA